MVMMVIAAVALRPLVFSIASPHPQANVAPVMGAGPPRSRTTISTATAGTAPITAGTPPAAAEVQEAPPSVDASALEYGGFLGRHDLAWHWVWDVSSAYTLQPRAAELSHCGSGGRPGACCLAAGVSGVSLAACDATTSPAQQWRLRGTGQYESGGQCLTDGGRLMAPCGTGGGGATRKQSWRSIDGYIFNTQTNNCLQVHSNTSFCTGTVCPLDRAAPFTVGAAIGTAQSNNGDRSQLFAAFTLPSAGSPIASQNRVPTTWTTSAYAGNGLLGLRIAAEAGSSGVLRLYMDRADVGEYGHRQPTGYFRLIVPNPHSLPLRVSMRQSLHEGAVRANISTAAGSSNTADGGGGGDGTPPLLSFRLFVDASSLANNGTAAFLTVTFQPGYKPVLEWVPCSSSGNSVGCGAAAINATRSSTQDGVALSTHSAKSGAGDMVWTSGWRWLDSAAPAAADGSTTTLTAVASIAACNTPACSDGSLGAPCPCATSLSAGGVDPAQACADAVNMAAARGVDAAFEAHKGWWAAYWPQSFVSLPVTRIEGYCGPAPPPPPPPPHTHPHTHTHTHRCCFEMFAPATYSDSISLTRISLILRPAAVRALHLVFRLPSWLRHRLCPVFSLPSWLRHCLWRVLLLSDYSQMYRFPSSDRIGLHGLMGVRDAVTARSERGK